MSSAFTVIAPGLLGVAIGAAFFLGLWWTLLLAPAVRAPGILIACSMLLRMSMALTGFYFVAADGWRPLLLCLGGFLLARFVVIRLTGTNEVLHAPQS